MGYRNLRACLADLERTRQLVRIEAEIDPNLEMAEIQRRVYAAGGPALYFANVKGCAFPMASNLFGTIERSASCLDALAAVRHLVELKIDPSAFWKNPGATATRPPPSGTACRSSSRPARSSTIKRPSAGCRS